MTSNENTECDKDKQCYDSMENIGSSDDELNEFSSEFVDQSLDQPFYFESDHLALKANKDYHQLLKTVFILEAQRARAINDLSQLLTHQAEALSDPLTFVQKLQRGQNLNLPKPQQIAEIPAIEWENYAVKFDLGKQFDHLHMTRFKKDKDVLEDNKGIVSAPALSTSSLDVVVRGRVKGAQKSDTFNQLWTAEEQMRLEELLIKYPPEEIESRRYDKIAKELGNRTRQQVASRIQKYFIKLARAGLPVPGKLPSANLCHQKLSKKRSRRNRGQVFRQSSTFMVKYVPPVFMPEDDDTSSMDSYSLSRSAGISTPVSSMDWNSQLYYRAEHSSDATDQDLPKGSLGSENESDDDVPESLQETEEYRELLRLKQLRSSLISENNSSLSKSCVTSDVESDATN